MCITVNHASLSKTKILSLPLSNENHFIAYSNSVKNLSGEPNAMILAIPGKTKPEWFHNTEEYKDFLKEITDNAGLDSWLGTLFLSRGMKGFDRFELGMYTIGLADSFEGAEEFINSLPENKRPKISEKLSEFFGLEYSGWSFAVCCFDSNKTIDAQPIAFEYTPFNSDFLYFPSLDAHDGDAPDLNASVLTDHTIIFEHTGKREKEYIMESLKLNAPVPDFLQNRKYRFVHMRGMAKNGDTFIKISEMNELEFSQDPKMYRIPPVPYEAGEPSDKYEYKLFHTDGITKITLSENDKTTILIEGPISVVSKAIGGVGDEDYSNNTVVVTEKHLKTEASRLYAIMEIAKICQENTIEKMSQVGVPTLRH
jgi:hypothetical protein